MMHIFHTHNSLLSYVSSTWKFIKCANNNKKNLSIFIVVLVHKMKPRKNPKQYHFFLSLYHIWTSVVLKCVVESFHCNITIITISRRPIFWHWCRRRLNICTQNLFIKRVWTLPSHAQCYTYKHGEECKDDMIIMAKMHASQL